MVGIPAMVLGLAMALSDRRPGNMNKGIALFGIGVVLQLVGHFVYERNLPVFMSKQRDPITMLSALVYVTQSWWRVLRGEPLIAVASVESNGNGSQKLDEEPPD